jgi:hypothetical protein
MDGAEGLTWLLYRCLCSRRVGGPVRPRYPGVVKDAMSGVSPSSDQRIKSIAHYRTGLADCLVAQSAPRTTTCQLGRNLSHPMHRTDSRRHFQTGYYPV